MALDVGESIAPIGVQASLALSTGRIVHTSQALARHLVAIADRVLVYVAVAIAFDALGAVLLRLLPAVLAHVAQVAACTGRAAQANYVYRLRLVVVELRAWAVIRTRTLFAVLWGSL